MRVSSAQTRHLTVPRFNDVASFPFLKSISHTTKPPLVGPTSVFSREPFRRRNYLEALIPMTWGGGGGIVRFPSRLGSNPKLVDGVT